MKKEHLVSVIIPTYNREDTILRAIESVLNQTYKNWELIIVDDGSTDNTKEVLEPYLKNKKISYFKTKNKGVCHARNFGIKKSKGEYIAFLDSDDEFLKDKIKKNVREINLKKVDFVLNNFYEFREGNKIRERFNYEKSFKINSSKVVRYQVPISTSYLFIKRTIAVKVLFDESLPSSNDLDFILRCLRFGNSFFLKERLNKTHKLSKSNRISTDPFKKIEGYKIILEKTKKNLYGLTKEDRDFLIKKTYFNLILFYCLSNKFKEGKKSFEVFLDNFPLEKKSLKVKILFYCLKFPRYGKIIFWTIKKLWTLGLTQN